MTAWRAMVPLVATFALAGVACGKADPAVDARPSPTATLARAGTALPGSETSDMMGRTIKVPEEVRRVVAISPSAVEFATALGLEIAGRPSDVPAASANNAPAVGSTISPDFNAIAQIEPDLVIADAAFHGNRTRDFDRFPYPVFVIKVAGYDDVLAAFSALGALTGRGEKAEEVTAAIKARVDAVLARVPSGAAPSVLIVTGAGREVYAGSDATYLGGLVRQLGATNVMGAAPQGAPIAGFGVVELAQVATLKPEVVLCLSSGQGKLSQDVRATPQWAGVPAVTRNRLHELDLSLFLRTPGPRVAEALEQLLPLLYP